MKGFTKLIDGYWVTGTTNIDGTWIKIEHDTQGKINAPLGLVNQELEEDKERDNKKIDRDIDKLEKKSLRALREAVLALTENAVLQKAEDDIVALRSQRK